MERDVRPAEQKGATFEEPSAICRQCLCPRRVVAEPCGSGSGQQVDSEHSRDSELTGGALVRYAMAGAGT